MSTHVTTKANETLDSVAWRTLGNTNALTELMLINPHINSVEPVLPVGTRVAVPQARHQTSQVKQLIQLYD